MHIRMMHQLWDWKTLLLLVCMVLLGGCKAETRGSVDLRDSAGERYSFAGATATLYPLNPSAVMPGQSRTVLATGTVAPEDGSVTLTANRFFIHESQWYVVEFNCPADAPDDDCDVAMPVHVVLTKADLQAGGWRATALTDVAFHAAAYGAAARFNIVDMMQVLNDTAQSLLALSYQDLLQWNPLDTAALRRPDQLARISTALAQGVANNEFKRLVQQWLGVGTATWTSPTPAFANDLIVTAPYVFLLSSQLNVLDVRDPQTPVQVGSLAFSSFDVGRQLERQGDLLYMIMENRRDRNVTLRIVDVSNPLQPDLAGTLSLPVDRASLVVDGDYAYLTERSYFSPQINRVSVVDVRNPQLPTHVASMDFSTRLSRIAKSGSHLFVSGAAELNIIDVSNPLAPTLAGSLPRQSGGALAVSGDHVFLQHDDAGLDVVDVSDVSAPVLVATLNLDWTDSDTTFGPIESILIEGSSAYLAFGGYGLHRIDISEPAAPRWAGSLDNPDAITTAVAISEGLAYVPSGMQGLRIFDTHALQRSPVLAARVDLPGRLNAHTVANPFVTYAPATGFGISIIDLWPLHAPELVTTHTSWIQQVSLSGRYAYLATFDEFQVLDIFNPFAPVALPGAIKMRERGFNYLMALDVAGDYAYVTAVSEVSNDLGRLVTIDIQNPLMPILSAQLDLPGTPGEVIVQGDRGYVVVEDTQLHVVDLQNPLLPLLAGNLNLSCPATFLAAAEDHLYVACGNGGVQILNVSDATAPVLTATLNTAGSANAITLEGSLAYIADAASGIVLVDVSDPAAPIMIGNAAVRGSARGVLLQNGQVYASTSVGLDVLKKPNLPMVQN